MNRLGIDQGRVRPMLPADLEQVLAWRNHPEVRRHMYSQHEITLDEHRQWYERVRQDPRKHLLLFESSQQPLGFVSFDDLARGGIAEWGFYAAPDAPKGTGRRLGRAALDHAFGGLKFHKIFGRALASNEGSIGFHRSLGFQQEGILRDHHFDGRAYHSVICFGLLSHEWKRSP